MLAAMISVTRRSQAGCRATCPRPRTAGLRICRAAGPPGFECEQVSVLPGWPHRLQRATSASRRSPPRSSPRRWRTAAWLGGRSCRWSSRMASQAAAGYFSVKVLTSSTLAAEIANGRLAVRTIMSMFLPGWPRQLQRATSASRYAPPRSSSRRWRTAAWLRGRSCRGYSRRASPAAAGWARVHAEKARRADAQAHGPHHRAHLHDLRPRHVCQHSRADAAAVGKLSGRLGASSCED
jgi:hypothetical protein